MQSVASLLIYELHSISVEHLGSEPSREYYLYTTSILHQYNGGLLTNCPDFTLLSCIFAVTSSPPIRVKLHLLSRRCRPTVLPNVTSLTVPARRAKHLYLHCVLFEKVWGYSTNDISFSFGDAFHSTPLTSLIIYLFSETSGVLEILGLPILRSFHFTLFLKIMFRSHSEVVKNIGSPVPTCENTSIHDSVAWKDKSFLNNINKCL